MTRRRCIFTVAAAAAVFAALFGCDLALAQEPARATRRVALVVGALPGLLGHAEVLRSWVVVAGLMAASAALIIGGLWLLARLSAAPAQAEQAWQE